MAADHLRLLIDDSTGIEIRIGAGIIELALPLRRVVPEVQTARLLRLAT